MFSGENTSSHASSCSRAWASIGANAGSSSSGASDAHSASSGTCSRSVNESRTSGNAPRRAIARTSSSTSGRARGVATTITCQPGSTPSERPTSSSAYCSTRDPPDVMCLSLAVSVGNAPGWCRNALAAARVRPGERVRVVVDEPLLAEGEQLAEARPSRGRRGAAGALPEDAPAARADGRAPRRRGLGGRLDRLPSRHVRGGAAGETPDARRAALARWARAQLRHHRPGDAAGRAVAADARPRTARATLLAELEGARRCRCGAAPATI